MKASTSYTSGLVRCPKHPDTPRERLASGKAAECRPCRRARDVERNRNDEKRRAAKAMRTQWVRTYDVWQRYCDQLGIPR